MPYVYSYINQLKQFKENMEQLSEADKGYLAGLLDGEGSIGLYFVPNRQGITIMSRLTIVTNNDKYLIDYVANLIGKDVGRTFLYKATQKLTGISGWHVKISHRAFIEVFLSYIYPYLIAKKDRAMNLLRFLELRKGRFHQPYTEEELNLVELSKKGNYIMGKAIKR